MGRRGKREFVQVLRLMENFRKEEVCEGVRDALRLGAISFDAVKHLVMCRVEGRPQRLDLQLYPYLPQGQRAEDLGQRLHGAHVGEQAVSERSTVLLEHPPQGAEAADVPERVRQGGGSVRRRGRRPSGLPAEAV